MLAFVMNIKATCGVLLASATWFNLGTFGWIGIMEKVGITSINVNECKIQTCQLGSPLFGFETTFACWGSWTWVVDWITTIAECIGFGNVTLRKGDIVVNI